MNDTDFITQLCEAEEQRRFRLRLQLVHDSQTPQAIAAYLPAPSIAAVHLLDSIITASRLTH